MNRCVLNILLLTSALFYASCYQVSHFGDLVYKVPERLKEEFDICPHWHDNMTWSEFLQVKNELKRKGLVKYVDKIEQQKIAKELGIEVPKTYIATREKTPFIDIISALPSYVAKMTHLSLSQGLIIVKDGVDIVTGDTVEPESVQEIVFKNLDSRARNVESWALHQVEPGFMIQEYIANREEVKIQTVWGKAIIGEWRGGERHSSRTKIWGRYDRDGNIVDYNVGAPGYWPEAIALAEKIAQKTDALRVDFLIKRDGKKVKILLNELEIWPESDWSSMRETLKKELNDGYRGMCEERVK